MHNYYFVAASLPPLALGEVPEITFEELANHLKLNLSRGDLEQVEVLRRGVDLQNIRALYSNQPLDPHGNLSEKELDEALLVETDFPEYVFEFLGQFDQVEEKVRHFFGLLSRYYTEEISRQKGVLRALLSLQREMRLVLAALRAKKTGRDIVKELQFEEFTEPLVAQILAQKDMEDYEPPIEYLDLKENLRGCGDDPWEQYRAIMTYEFEKIRDLAIYPRFSFSWVLGYVARLILVERYNALSSDRGQEIIDKYKTG